MLNVFQVTRMDQYSVDSTSCVVCSGFKLCGVWWAGLLGVWVFIQDTLFMINKYKPHP